MKLSDETIGRVAEELGRAELGDPRRNRRLKRFVERLAGAPSASVPAALVEDAEVQAGYRLLNNAALTFDRILKPHIESTSKRLAEVGEVLVLHDTTDCSFPSVDPQELGYLSTGKAGFRLHLSLAVDGTNWRRPIGIVNAETIFRAKRSSKKRRSRTKSNAFAEREFSRWWKGIDASANRLAACNRVIHIADRESDAYQLMWQTIDAKQSFIFRTSVRDRRGQRADSGSEAWSTIEEIAQSCEGSMEREVALSRRKTRFEPGINSKTNPPRKARLAKLSFAATRISILRPAHLHAPMTKTIELNLIRVSETSPPDGEQPVEWLLYTDLPVDTEQQIAQIVDRYRSRWLIEEFNAALKTGCAYEERHFESRNALLALLAISLPIACELLALRSHARSSPTSPASEVLSERQLSVLRAFTRKPLSPYPTAQEALLAVAGLGGHLKRNGPPGWKVLYRGMQKLAGYEAGWAAARAAAKQPDDL